MARNRTVILFLILIMSVVSSCSEDISDCPSNLCVMAGGWKLVDVELDGEHFQTDYKDFKLTLFEPASNEQTTATFERTAMSGTADSGTWSLENTNQTNPSFSGSILRLKPSNNSQLQEDWHVESFSPRQMILELHRDVDAKEGPAVIRFVLEPF